MGECGFEKGPYAVIEHINITLGSISACDFVTR
jgi:hypothetical protein